MRGVSYALSILVLWALACAGVMYAQNPAEIKLRDLAFISGQWEGSMEGERIEEHWSNPSGDSMMGMFKWLKEGNTAMYEFLSIEQETDGPTLKLKHFHRGLIGWEEKNDVFTYPLVSFREGEARFENPRTKTALEFRRVGADQLVAILEHEKDGKRSSERFDYTRSK